MRGSRENIPRFAFWFREETSSNFYDSLGGNRDSGDDMSCLDRERKAGEEWQKAKSNLASKNFSNVGPGTLA